MSFETTTAVEAIYRSRKANVIKSDWYQSVRDSAGGFESTFTARFKSRHAIKRRLLSHAFSERALKDYEPRIASLIDTWVDQLDTERKEGNGVVPLGDWCNYLIFDILGDLCFGKSFGLTSSGEDRSIVGLIPRATGSWYSLGYHPFTKLLRYLLFRTRLGPLLGGQPFRDNARFRTFCLQTLRWRQQALTANSNDSSETKAPPPSTGLDMFYHLLNGRDPETGQGYTRGDLACESVLLVVAGSQSTSGALAAIFFYLAHNPGKLAHLRHELHSAFPIQDDIPIRYEPGGKLASLPYLRACIDESMRLTPPTPGHLPREVVGADGLTVDGHWFPPGTTVGASAYALHRNEAYFRGATQFRPERWLSSSGEAEKERAEAEAAFNPFSAGATGCIGRQLAYMELSLAVAKVLWRFDLRIPQWKHGKEGGGDDDTLEYQVRDCFVAEGEGPDLELVPNA
ncbi:MAG: hypothetical protein Q9227_005802 [Pyrenula ochraceoflavens]